MKSKPGAGPPILHHVYGAWPGKAGIRAVGFFMLSSASSFSCVARQVP